jgi:dihydrofolate reductase
MRRIVNSTFVSLDGVINHMDRWRFDYVDAESNQVALDQLSACQAMLMGRNTYEVYAAAWPGRPGEYAARINAMPEYVVSHTLRDSSWANTEVVTQDLAAWATSFKSEGEGDLLMHGYGPVAKTLLRENLLDVLHLWVHPTLAGIGEPDDCLLTQDLSATLNLTDVHRLSSGVVMLSYDCTNHTA